MKDFFFGFEHSPLLWCALPVFLLLLLLYLLHRRSKVRIVPAIFLWDRPEASPNSGTRLQFRLPPVLFYLELAILLLLTAALAAPFISTPETFPPLAVILDDGVLARYHERLENHRAMWANAALSRGVLLLPLSAADFYPEIHPDELFHAGLLK